MSETGIKKRIEGKMNTEKEKNLVSNHPAQHRSLIHMVYTAVLAAALCVCSIVSVTIGDVPITLQTFSVCTAAALLGCKSGAACVLVYVLLGAVGLPVFAGMTGGVGILCGCTGGYIIGFIFTALIVGFAAEKFDRSLPALLISMSLGVLVCYAFGTPWFMFVTKYDFATSLGFCFTPFIAFDAIKIVLSAVIVNRLSKIIKL